MKFNSIRIPDKLTKEKGIDSIDINRLHNTIAFIGKNGSGKSRILDLIEKNLSKLVSLQNLRNNVFIPTDDSFRIKHLQSTNPNELGSFAKTFAHNYIRRIHSNQIQNIKTSFENDLRAKSFIPFEKLVSAISENNYNELDSLYASALTYFFQLAHDLASDNVNSFILKQKFEDTISYNRFLSLKELVENLLKKELTWDTITSTSVRSDKGNTIDYKGEWKLDGRVFDYDELSEGQKTLFSYAFLLFLLDQNPNLNIKESILIVDEPELHLHPESEIDLVLRLKDLIHEKGQLIFATHSVNILSILEYDEVFTVVNGVIRHPSSANTSESLTQLMGIDDRISKLGDFLNSISTWTYVNFMAECFDDPDVIKTARPNDPLILRFKEAIRALSTKSKNLLLDLGAGKGRLLEQIKTDYDFINKVSYSAFEPVEEFHHILNDLGATNIYSDYSKLPSNTFDFVVLCNVLHEIPLDTWEDSLNKIINTLEDDGYLIIMEAKVLNKGEKIGKIGYLLLDVEEIQLLFRLPYLPEQIILGNEDDLKMLCVAIPKNDLITINKSDIINCLSSLETNSFNKIAKLRELEYEKKDFYKIGRKSAFLSQQYVNAKLALDHLNNTN